MIIATEKNSDKQQDLLQLSPVSNGTSLVESDVNEWTLESPDEAISGASCGCRCRA